MGTFTTIPAAGAKLRGSVFSALLTELRPVRAALSSDFPLATGTGTLANVTGLVVPVAASTKYDGELWLGAQLAAGTTEDISIAMTWPTGATMYVATGELVTSATSFSGDFEMVWRAAHASGAAIANAGLNATLPTWTVMHFTLTVSTTAGNLQVQAAQVTPGANVVTVKAQSKLILHQAE